MSMDISMLTRLASKATISIINIQRLGNGKVLQQGVRFWG